MNILFLSHRIPYPPDKGDKIRSFNELKYLSGNHDLYLGTLVDQEDELEYVRPLEELCKQIHAVPVNTKLQYLRNLVSTKPFSVSHFYHKDLQKYVDRTIQNRKIEAIICFCSSMAEYLFKNTTFRENGLKGKKLIMDYVDLDSDKWAQYAKYSGFPLNVIYRTEKRRLLAYEIKINQLFEHSIFVSSREARMFGKLNPDSKSVQVICNGVDFGYFAPKRRNEGSIGLKMGSKAKNAPALVFTGVMDYFANEDGVRWFCEEIFPKIRSMIPETQFYIVGNRPTNGVWRLSEIDGVTVTGYVDDIRVYYWMADVCVMPLRIARGLQNKVLEAMATGNAVVATSNASDGIICENNGDIVIADEPEKFAEEVIGLIRNENRRIEIGGRAVENIRTNYSWEANLKAFDEILMS